MNLLEIVNIRCKYSYNGDAPNITFANKKNGQMENWDISVGRQNNNPFIILKNIDQGYTEIISLTEELYNKIVLGQEPNMADYLRTAYQLNLERSCKGATIA